MLDFARAATWRQQKRGKEKIKKLALRMKISLDFNFFESLSIQQDSITDSLNMTLTLLRVTKVIEESQQILVSIYNDTLHA